MLAVKLPSGGFVCQSIANISSNTDLNFLGSDDDYDEEVRVKDCNVWDDEW